MDGQVRQTRFPSNVSDGTDGTAQNFCPQRPLLQTVRDRIKTVDLKQQVNRVLLQPDWRKS